MALCKTFFKCKIFSSEIFLWKRKYFQVFGGTQKNALKNTFSTSYSHFLNFQTNIYYRFSIYKHKRNKTKQKHSSNSVKLREREREINHGLAGGSIERQQKQDRAVEAIGSQWVARLTVVCSTWVERKMANR